ncbi:DUF5819 family protein [Streptomyces cavernae]|uniref:DUF5819 family protein n=1 Tax=Streptomyces cavernae TaxID=2259034 RepID=UPI000FEBE3CD|nr:DUF5819 family protein [Streptomyces cavernae]
MDAYDEGSSARPVPGAPECAGGLEDGAPRSAETGVVIRSAETGVVIRSGIVGSGPDERDGIPGDGSGAVPARGTGIGALSLRYRIAVLLALAVVASAAGVHLGMVFLHVAPDNTVSKEYGTAIGEWVYPEFEQNWKLFAPNPLQQNIAVQVRADVRTPDGGADTTGWYDLSASDGAAIEGSLLPSHTRQNQLRRAWDFYTATHDAENRPNGLRGALSERYMLRIALLRLETETVPGIGKGVVVERVQLRSRTTNVPPPEWSDEKVSLTPSYRELPWWPVSDGDGPVGTAGKADAE